MSGGGGGGGSTNTIQKADPWKGQQPYLKDVFNQAQNLYQQGVPDYYPGDMVAPFSPYTQQGIGSMYNRGAFGSPQQAAMGDYLMGTMQQPGINTSLLGQAGADAMGGMPAGQQMMYQAGQPITFQQAANMAGLGGGLTGFGGIDPYSGTALSGLGEARNFVGDVLPGSMPSTQNYVEGQLGAPVDFADAAGQIGAQFGGMGQYDPLMLGQQFDLSAAGLNPVAAGALAQTASGGMLGANPYLDDMFDAASRQITDRYQNVVAPGIDATFGSAGRTGGGIHGLTAAEAGGEYLGQLGDLAADMYGSAYESERGRQMQAAGQLGGLGLTAGGQDLQAQTDAARLGLTAGQANQQAGLDAARLGLSGDQSLLNAAQSLYGVDAGNQLGAAQLGGNLFSALNAADLARTGQAVDLFGTGMQGDASARALAANLYGGGLDRMQTSGAGLADIGLQGLGSMNDLYANIGRQQALGASMVPTFSGLQYNDINAMLQSGGMLDQRSQDLINADIARHNYYRDAPANQLSQYSNIVNQLPGGLGTSTTSQDVAGNSLSGLAGGALTGAGLGYAFGNPATMAALGPWALGGALLGGLL